MRVARAEDAGAVAAALGAAGDRRDGGAVAPSAVEATLARADVTVLLAEVGTTTVGVLVLRHGETLPLGASAASVHQMAVTPSHRRRGVGRSLLAAAVQLAEADGAQHLVVSAPPGGREAHRFLARLGFSPLVVQRSAPVATLRRSLGAPAVGGEVALRRAAVERVLLRRRRERGLAGTA